MCNLDTDEALKIHIEGLQSTLGKRNARIKELEDKLNEPIDVPAKVEKMLEKAYKQGWKDCANNLIQATDQVTRLLSSSRKAAMSNYLNPGLSKDDV